MTRFARKDKVQGSNKREPEEATPWSEMVATIKSQHRDIEDDEEDVLMEVVEETEAADHHADDGSDDDDDSDENADIFAPKMKISGNVESESEEDEKIYESPAAAAAKENAHHQQRKVGEKAKVQEEEEVDSSDEPKKKKKKRKKRPLKCLVCGSGEHKKMFCEQLPEERRKELQELYQMKVERKGKGTGRKKNKNKNKNKLPYEGNQQQDNKENEVKKGNEDKKKKNKKNKRVFKEEIRDRSGAVVEAGEAMFQGFRVRQDDKEKLDALFKELKSKGLSKSELDGAMKRERRIAEKKLARAKKLVCFNCRQPGHMLADCPTAAAAPGLHDHGRPSTGICFKCGSLDHLSKDCHSKQKREGAYSFANCFICKQDGHLAKACPDNPKGLYPKGGGCVFCGSVEHLKRDCKRKVEKDLSAGIKVETMGDNIEEEPVHISSRPFVKKKKSKDAAKMSKVVAF